MGDSFELTAASAEDPRLEERLRTAPQAVRVRMLAEADGLRRGSDAQRRLAVSVYRALAGEIDPADAAHAERARWFVAESSYPVPADVPLLRRIADRSSDPAVGSRAALLDACVTAREGRAADAARTIAGIAERAAGSLAAVESDALLLLARVAADHEDAPTALRAGARALDRCADAGPSAECAARRARADAFALIGDATRGDREIAGADRAAMRLPRSAARAANAEIAASRARACLARGDCGEVVRLLPAAADDGRLASPERLRPLHLLGARAMLALDRSDLAAAHLARAMRCGEGGPAAKFEVEMVQVHLQRAAGGPASARPSAVALLDRIASEGRRVLGPLRRADVALDLARLIAGPPQEERTVLRAHDLAATFAFEAHAAAEAAALADAPDDDDAQALREHTVRILARRVEIRRAAATHLESMWRRGGVRALAGRTGLGDWIALCPWCARARGPSGWIPEALLGASADVAELAHGACESCAPVVDRRLAAASERDDR